MKDILSEEILDEFVLSIFKKEIDYKVEYIEEKNIGNYIIIDNEGELHFVSLINYRLMMPEEKEKGRNSEYQSVSTAYRMIKTEFPNAKNFYFYDFGFESDSDYSKSIIFYIRLLLTIGFIPLNPIMLSPFNSITELLKTRKNNRRRNNRPSFVTIDSNGIVVYGKTYGANAKEIFLIVIALRSLFEGDIYFYQIPDSNNEKFPELDLNFMKSSLGVIEEETPKNINYFTVSETSNIEEENFRNPMFISNLYDLYGEKACALCNCEVEQIIDGAHILPIEAIKKLTVTDEEKMKIATDPQNGLWLCKNHHYLYDRGFLKINDEGYMILKNTHEEYIIDLTNNIRVDSLIKLDKEMLEQREEFYRTRNIKK